MISVLKKLNLELGLMRDELVIESSASNECVGGHVFW
jgi:hypothetical protein